MSAWRDISTAPKDETTVLLWAEPLSEPVIGWFGAEENTDFGIRPAGWISSLGDFMPEGKQPTHWMPLADPPKDADT